MEHFMQFSTPIDASICFVGALVLFVVFVCCCGCFFPGNHDFFGYRFFWTTKKTGRKHFFNLQIVWPQISSESPKDLKNLGFCGVNPRISCGRKRSLVANSWPLAWRREETHYELSIRYAGPTPTRQVFFERFHLSEKTSPKLFVICTYWYVCI